MRTIVLLLAILVPSLAVALPAIQTSSGDGQGVLISFSTLENYVSDDLRSVCYGTVIVTQHDDRELRAGDEVKLTLVDDDLLFDDELWSETYSLTGNEAQAGRLSRSFDCSQWNSEPDEIEADLKIKASVDKASCGTFSFCSDPDADTNTITVTRQTDDAADAGAGDDSRETASALTLPVVNTRSAIAADRIARDADWVSFTLQARSRFTLDLDFYPAGDVELTLYDDQNAAVNGEAQNISRGSRYLFNSLEAGSYTAKINPANASDLNFYDLYAHLVGVECSGDDTLTEACGNCGSMVMTCSNTGTWVAGECMNQGECTPGTSRETECGRCGLQIDNCSATCEWRSGLTCLDQGECSPGENQTTADGCVTGFRDRTCNSECTWDDWGICASCEEGTNALCYTGPDGTANVGACVPGVWTCTNGSFGECRGETVPAEENCTDGIDNDCDGNIDADDEECSVPLGGPCARDAQCEEGLECFDQDIWVEGYCGQLDCDECEELGGVCATVYGAERCLAPCEGEPSCRDDSDDYICVQLGPNDEGACIPACRTDVDCTGISEPVCGDEGICVAESATGGSDGTIGGDDPVTTGGVIALGGADEAGGDDDGGNAGSDAAATGGSDAVTGGSDEAQPVTPMMPDMPMMPPAMPMMPATPPATPTTPTTPPVTPMDSAGTTPAGVPEAGEPAPNANDGVVAPASDDDGCSCDMNTPIQSRIGDVFLFLCIMGWGLRRRLFR